MPFKRVTATVLATVLLAGIAIVAPVQVASAAGVLPTGFSDESVITGLSLPTSVEFAPNGKIFVTEKAGRVKMFDSLSDTTPTLVADLRTQVYNYWDKGLLGLTVDPEFPSRPYIYVLYSYDAYIGDDAPRWGQADQNGDPCLGSPNGPGSTVDGCVSSARVSRLTLDNGVMTSERVLIEDWCNQYYSHSIGTVAFGADGYLYAGGGDGADPATSNIDYGQKGGTITNPSTGDPYTPKNPCGDPPADVGETMPKETAQGGALRAQSKRRPNSQPVVLNGTIIRIDPDTGNAVNTNQNYYDGRDENDRRVVTYGLRNPFRFTFKPNTNELWVGDVGAGTWEEINRIQNPIGAMTNHGWPCYEGNVKMGSWDNANINSCENLYAGGSAAIAEPYYVYRHNQTLYEDDTCVTSGGSITGIAFEDGSNYPSRYDGALFFADFARDCIWVMRKGTNGLPDSTKVEVFEKDAGGPVELQSGPDGNIYYADLDGGAIHRISYSAGNQAPDIDAVANPTSGPAPLQVNFDASDTTDPEGDEISFAWDLDNDGSYDDDTGPTAQRTYGTGTHRPSVRATDEHGASSTFDFTIVSGNSAPQPVIDTPSNGTTWAVGQELNLTGHATDSQDGNLAASRLSWRVIMHHCTGATAADCHEHIIEDRDGTSGFSFDAPDHEYPSHIEIELTARDSGGLEATVSRILQPKTVQLTFTTSPSGLKITAAGENKSGPFTMTFIQGAEIALDAPASQTASGVSYTFDKWSDNGSRVHNIKAPSSNTTYTATYKSGGTADAPNTCADATTNSAQSSWLRNPLSSNSDEDWYRFTLGSKQWVRVMLGNLPANYRIDLYSSCDTQIATSNRANKEYEEIYKELAAGTYRVRVRRASGDVNAGVSYGLRFKTYGTGLHILSSSAYTDGAGFINVVGEVLNNTAVRYRLVRVEATFYDGSNNVIGAASSMELINVMRGRTRGPFRISVAKPADYDHYTVAVNYSQETTNEVVQKLSFGSSSTSWTNTTVRYKGSLKNNNSFQVKYTQAVGTLYDTWGTVINTAVVWTSPMNISAGATSNYDVLFSDRISGWNRALILLQGTRGT